MRIYCAVRHSNDPKRFYGGLWSGNFYPALRQLGHEVVESQVDLAPASQFMEIAKNFTPEQLQIRAQITQQIVDEVREEHRKSPIGLFLSYFYNSHFDPAGFADIHAMGIPTINYYCNSIYQFELVAAIAPKADFAWHAEKHARDSYLAVDAKPVWVQMGADPAVYRPVVVEKRQADTCFVGQRYADRDRWMADLIRAKIPVALYGPGWGEKSTAVANPTAPTKPVGKFDMVRREVMRNINRNGVIGGLLRSRRQQVYRRESRELMSLFAPIAQGPIPFEKICQVFSEHEVILNFSNVWSDGKPGSELIAHVRLRDFEAPMCRTCYLSGHTDELAEFYEIGKEVDTYRTADELIKKCRYYLSHPEKAEAMREAGYQRALRDHTWVRRFEQLFRETGIAK